MFLWSFISMLEVHIVHINKLHVNSPWMQMNVDNQQARNNELINKKLLYINLFTKNLTHKQ